MNTSSLKRLDMACDSKGITQFYLPPTREPYLPLVPSCRASLLFGWYSLCLCTEGWPGWVDLGGWLYTEIGFCHQELNPRPFTHPSTNRARRRVTALIDTNVLALCQTASVYYLCKLLTCGHQICNLGASDMCAPTDW